MADALERAVDALVRSTNTLAEEVLREDPVALATALDTRIEAIEWLEAHREDLPDEIRALLARIAKSDACLESRAQESLAEVRAELAQIRTGHESLRRIASRESPPRFVSRRA